MNEKRKVQLEMLVKFQTSMLSVIQDILDGKREEKEGFKLGDVLSDITYTTSMMGKVFTGMSEEDFTEEEKDMYSTMVMLFKLSQE
jgi:hypothetical protein